MTDPEAEADCILATGPDAAEQTIASVLIAFGGSPELATTFARATAFLERVDTLELATELRPAPPAAERWPTPPSDDEVSRRRAELDFKRDVALVILARTTTQNGAPDPFPSAVTNSVGTITH